MYADWNYPEPCMCGAMDCVSCGPAQGYSRCEVCGLWECLDPEACQRAIDAMNGFYERAMNGFYERMDTPPHCAECGLTKQDIESEARRHLLVDPVCCDMTEFYHRWCER
jgi:hypothetical protein